jgi:hypothetical protein
MRLLSFSEYAYIQDNQSDIVWECALDLLRDNFYATLIESRMNENVLNKLKKHIGDKVGGYVDSLKNSIIKKYNELKEIVKIVIDNVEKIKDKLKYTVKEILESLIAVFNNSSLRKTLDKLTENTTLGAIISIISEAGKIVVKLAKALSQARNEIFDKSYGMLEKTKAMQVVKSNIDKLQLWLDKNPWIKKITGPLVGGLLFYGWTKMTFVGDFEYDFDLSPMLAALEGDYNLADWLVGTPQGAQFVFWLTFGATTGIGAAWMGSVAGNATVGMLCVLLIKAGLQNTIIFKVLFSILGIQQLFNIFGIG